MVVNQKNRDGEEDCGHCFARVNSSSSYKFQDGQVLITFGPTNTSNACTLNSSFIAFAATAAALDFGWPILCSRNKNWRDKLDSSMRSASVTVNKPPGPQQMLLRAKFLRNSQPSAPHPTCGNNDDCEVVIRME